MPNKLELEGKRFVRLLVIKNTGNKIDGNYVWECLCDCGKTVNLRGSYLTRGINKSCGCYHKEMASVRNKTHGLSNSKEYKSEYLAWENMKSRCYYKGNDWYHIYGGKGVTVCDRWRNSFPNFLEDMGKKPTSLHSLDRKESTGNYEPTNCKWSTKKEQSDNTCRNIKLNYKGEVLGIKDWGRRFRVSYQSINYHLSKGKSFETIHDYYNNKLCQNKSYVTHPPKI